MTTIELQVFSGSVEDLLWPSEDVAILGAGQAHCGGVDDGHEGLDVLHQEPVEESLITLLDPHQVDVPEHTHTHISHKL